MNLQDSDQKSAIDQNKIQQFMNKAVQDIAGSSTAVLVIVGEIQCSTFNSSSIL